MDRSLAISNIQYYVSRSGVTGRIYLDRRQTVDFVRAILSHECATSSRDKLADAATVEWHAATFIAQTNAAASAPVFPLHDPPSQTQFQNDDIVQYPNLF